MRKRNCRVEIYFTKDELESLTKKVRKSGLSRESFCRHLLNGAEIKEAPSADVPMLINEVRRVGYNIDQILRMANARGMYSAHENVAYNMKKVPIWEKYALSLSEAAEYFHIGTRRLRQIIAKDKYAKYLIWNGGRVFFKRKMFEEYLNNEVQLFSNNNTES